MPDLFVCALLLNTIQSDTNCWRNKQQRNPYSPWKYQLIIIMTLSNSPGYFSYPVTAIEQSSVSSFQSVLGQPSACVNTGTQFSDLGGYTVWKGLGCGSCAFVIYRTSKLINTCMLECHHNHDYHLLLPRLKQMPLTRVLKSLDVSVTVSFTCVDFWPIA